MTENKNKLYIKKLDYDDEFIPYHVIELIISGKFDSKRIVKTHSKQYNKLITYRHGISLDGFIKRGDSSKLSFDEKVDLFIQMIDSLTYVHSYGIYHCDIKPANFVIDKNKIKLIDFGLARFTKYDKSSTMSTVNYRPPEYLFMNGYKKYLCTNNHDDGFDSEKIDVWCLGLTALELFLDKEVFDDYTDSQHYRSIMKFFGKRHRSNTKIFLPTSKLFDKLKNEKLKNLLKHMLNGDQESRYSMDDIIHDDFFKHSDKHPIRNNCKYIEDEYGEIGILEDDDIEQLLKSFRRDYSSLSSRFLCLLKDNIDFFVEKCDENDVIISPSKLRESALIISSILLSAYVDDGDDELLDKLERKYEKNKRRYHNKIKRYLEKVDYNIILN